MHSNRWIIVSNRLPFTKSEESGKLIPSSGGLVAAITGIRANQQTLWVGAAPSNISPDEWKEKIGKQGEKYVPVFLPKKIYDSYYNGFANNVLWPLFHYESNLVEFDWKNWADYERANEKFADAIAKIATPQDLIWIHDFHLMLVPHFLRKKKKRLRIGFFLHIPFPSSEIFRQLPVRKELLTAILSSDVIGFHDYSYLRHFCVTLQLVLGHDPGPLSVKVGERTVRLGVYPVSINTQRFVRESNSTRVKGIYKKLIKNQKSKHLILGVDRLDYIKGIELKLLAFNEMLHQFPELQGEVSLFQIAVPSRSDVTEYQKLKRQIDELVGKINGEFGKPNYTPVQYMYSSVSFHELLALYRAADVLLVTSRRDGMNLVSLEYIAAQSSADPGVVLLSEFTGAISTLSEVTPINPWDCVMTARTIAQLLNIPRKERQAKHKPMLDFLKKYTATDWAKSFINSLQKSTSHLQKGEIPEILGGVKTALSLPTELKTQLRRGPFLVLLDYDGTLVPIQGSPEAAVLSPEAHRAMQTIRKKKGIEIVVVSGRNAKFLDQQFRDFDISLAAEHGAKFYHRGRRSWQSLVHTNKQSWYATAHQIMKDYAARVPGSFVEKKEFALSWHFRQSPVEFANYQSRRLKEELELGLSNYPVTILSGKKVVEARSIEANKGAFARWYFDEFADQSKTHILVGLGDDQTDEDLFASFPENGVTIKVGEGGTCARYRMSQQQSVVPFLLKLADMIP